MQGSQDKVSGKFMVDIRTLLHQLRQQIESAEWHGESSEALRREYDEVLTYHNSTGSHYYPLF